MNTERYYFAPDNPDPDRAVIDKVLCDLERATLAFEEGVQRINARKRAAADRDRRAGLLVAAIAMLFVAVLVMAVAMPTYWPTLAYWMSHSQ